jgi:hypothetical protein
MSLQRIFSIDNRMIQEVIEKITLESLEALKKKDNLSKDFNKFIDAILPTESGLLPPTSTTRTHWSSLARPSSTSI